MTIRYHGILLLAGTVIQVVYPRYDWVSPGKKFRIESVNYQSDGLVDIVAKEYDDSFYTISHISTSRGTKATTVPTGRPIGNPSNLIVTSADSLDELLNGVQLFWDNDPAANESSVSTEIYGSLSPKLFIVATDVNGTTEVLTSSEVHGFVPGMPVYAQSTSNGIVDGSIYYVHTTPSTTTFTLREDKLGTTPVDLTTGSGLSIIIRTATLLGVVPVPARSYVDTVVNEGTGRVEKYYWVRHKVKES